jgi:hypothetical protein
MIMLLVVVLGALPMPLFGGRASRLGDIPVRATGLLFLSIGTQVVITTVSVPSAVGQALHIGTYLVVIPFLWVNRGLPGLWVVFAGAVANMAAIFANGGVMPASPAAVRLAGLDLGAGFENSAPMDDARLWFLGDVFAVPAWVPLANVFSIGDVVIVAGALILIYRSCGASWSRRAAVDTGSGPDGPGRPRAGRSTAGRS